MQVEDGRSGAGSAGSKELELELEGGVSLYEVFDVVKAGVSFT